MAATADALRQRLAGAPTVGVVGLGYVGLPLAVAFAESGATVVGVDLDAQRVAAVRAGRSFVEDVPAATLARVVGAGRLGASDDVAALKDADAIVICVPTPLGKSKEPDISYIVAAADAVARVVRRGQLVVLESTTYPGTTREILLPRLEARGLRAGEDFFLAFSPERIDPGNRRFTLRDIPKVVGGLTPACGELAAALYARVAREVVPVSGPEAAEMAKLFENTFRSVNIALVNEFAIMCRRLGISVWEIIAAAATKPFGFMPFYPGPGLGGHCLGPEEWLYCRRGRLVGPERAQETWEAAIRAGGKIRRDPTLEVILDPGTQVLGIQPDGRVGWENVTAFARRMYPGRLFRITTRGGYAITVTDRHPLLVLSSGRLTVREARQVVRGDLIPTFSGQSDCLAETGNPTLEVIPLLSLEQRKRTRVRIVGGSWYDYRRELLSLHGWTARDFWRDEAAPLDLYLRLEAAGAIPNLREKLLLMTGRGPSWSSLPAVLELTPEFARLVGYYLSEGCLTEDGTLRVRFAFHSDETDYIEDVLAVLKSVGLRASVYRDRRWRTTHVKVSSSLFGVVIRDGLVCGVNSYEMRIPPLLLGASERHRAALLSGLLRGDGSVWARAGFEVCRKGGRRYRNHAARAQVGYYSVSEPLARGVIFLLQSLGFAPAAGRKRPDPGIHVRLWDALSLERLETILAGRKAARLVELRAARRRRRKGTWVQRIGRFTAAAVATVRPIPGPNLVYSVETETTHTLVAGYGHFVHNCLPSDPHYLSWRVRLEGYEPRFITFADEINRRMPEYVVQLVADALNDRGRAVRGADVLVLGVAYKANVADTRDSPALEIIAALAAKGATVAYHDPFVPALRLDRLTLASVDWGRADLGARDVVLVLTAHAGYDWAAIVREARLVVDTRNATGGLAPAPHVIRL